MSIAENIARIQEDIAEACAIAERNPSEVQLMGVTKTVPVERIQESILAGIPLLGENYIQESLPKIESLGHTVPWHFIGHLQRNKSKVAAQNFDCIQTIDSLSLAQSLSRHAGEAGRILPLLLEVNLAEDSSRPGVIPSQTLTLADAVLALPNLYLQGLMGMPPPGPDAEFARPFFRTLKRLWDSLHNENRLILSMGMTTDYRVAIEEGSTLIRIGTGIFGRR